MTAQIALKSALREVVGPAARGRGYKGTPPNWRKSSALGDWAVVNVQSSSGSTAESLTCVVNLSFAPEPWLRWRARKWPLPKAVPEHLGMFRHRVHRGVEGEREEWWEVVDERSATTAATHMAEQLERLGWPLLEQVFSRDFVIDRIRRGDTRFAPGVPEVYLARCEALMLMDKGMSDRLELILEAGLQNSPEIARESSENFNTWVRAEARKAQPASG